MQHFCAAWRAMLLLLAVAFCATRNSHATFLPSPKPLRFKHGDTITAVANSLTSYQGEHLKHNYYDLRFCKPEGGAKLQGHGGSHSSVPGSEIFPQKRVFDTPYEFKITIGGPSQDVRGLDWGQKTLNACPDGGSAGPLTADQARAMKEAVDDMSSDSPQYRTRLELDGIPITEYDIRMSQKLRRGFKLGVTESSHERSADGSVKHRDHFIFNHLAFNILLHRSNAVSSGKEALWEVVGFEVMPCSIKREKGDKIKDVQCNPWGDAMNPEPQRIYKGADIIYTYDVYFTESSTPWHSRWNAYSMLPLDEQHMRYRVMWASLLAAFLLALLVAEVCRRSRVATGYHASVQGTDGIQVAVPGTGWAVPEEVFRMHVASELLSALFGAGAHMLCAAVGVVVLFRAGELSPEWRHAWPTLTAGAYLFTSPSAGYFSVLLWRHLHRNSTESGVGVAAKAVLLFPGLTLATLALRHLIRTQADMHSSIPSSEQAPFMEHFALYFLPAFMWFNVAMIGAFAAPCASLRVWPTPTGTVTPPTRDGALEIPGTQTLSQSWGLRSHSANWLWSGALTSLVLYSEAYWLAESALGGYLYHISWATFAATALTAVITAELSVIRTGIQLRAGSPNWWWRSFAQGAFVAVPLCLRGVLHAVFAVTWSQVVLYLCYTLVAGGVVAVCCGTISLGASLLFVCWVYKAHAIAVPSPSEDAAAKNSVDKEQAVQEA